MKVYDDVMYFGSWCRCFDPVDADADADAVLYKTSRQDVWIHNSVCKKLLHAKKDHGSITANIINYLTFGENTLGPCSSPSFTAISYIIHPPLPFLNLQEFPNNYPDLGRPKLMNHRLRAFWSAGRRKTFPMLLVPIVVFNTYWKSTENASPVVTSRCISTNVKLSLHYALKNRISNIVVLEQ